MDTLLLHTQFILNEVDSNFMHFKSQTSLPLSYGRSETDFVRKYRVICRQSYYKSDDPSNLSDSSTKMLALPSLE